jgi:predicted molibdopterin-dependent oxidoreductase YjgC
VSYTEKDGTFTNTERRVQVVRKAMLELPGARADWTILMSLAATLGLDWNYANSAQILAEISRTTPIYAGASRRTLGQTGARWPLTPDGETPSLSVEMLTGGVAREPAAAGRGEQVR